MKSKTEKNHKIWGLENVMNAIKERRAKEVFVSKKAPYFVVNYRCECGLDESRIFEMGKKAKEPGKCRKCGKKFKCKEVATIAEYLEALCGRMGIKFRNEG